ncbi:hypothetical protein ABLU85_03225 [Klebsiella sp. GG_Kp154]|uniref:hypothetical protein n=1 Tax=Klebsiella sp. GG_Kp154 TaxID=3153465 RepID=UPI0032B3E64D
MNDFRHIRTHCATRRLRQVAPRQTLHRRRYRLRHLLVLSARIVVRRRRPAHLRADLLLARTAIPSRYQLRPRRCPRRRVALRRLRVQLALRHQHITHLAPDFTCLLRCRQPVLLFLLIKYRTIQRPSSSPLTAPAAPASALLFPDAAAIAPHTACAIALASTFTLPVALSVVWL